MQKIKENYYISIFLLLTSLLFGQMIRIPIAGKIVLVSDIAVVLFLISNIKYLISNIKNKKHYLFLPVVSFILFSVLSLIFAIPSLGFAKVITAGMYLVRWILYAGAVFAIANFPDREKAERTVFWGIIGTGFLLSIAGFIQLKIHPDFADMVKFGWDPHKNRLLSTWYDPNLLAGYYAVALAFLAAYFAAKFKVQSSKFKSTQNSKPKNLMFSVWHSFELWILNFELKNAVSDFQFLISSFVIYFAFMLTYSRSGYLALAAVFITICILNFNWKFFIAGLIIAPLTLAIFPRSYQRVSDAAQVDVTSQMRIDSWQDGWDVIKKNSLFGVGFNALQWRREGGCTEHASSGFDSSLLTIWAATGIFGLASYIWIIWEIIRKKYRDFKNHKEKNTDLNQYSRLPARNASRIDAGGQRFLCSKCGQVNNDFQKIFSLGSIAAIIGLLVHSCFVNSLLYPHILLVFWLISV